MWINEHPAALNSHNPKSLTLGENLKEG